MFTSFYDPNRAFKETNEFVIVVKGDGIPRHFKGKGHIVFAVLKSWYLALAILVKSMMGEKYDVLIVDQISASIPILRLTGSKILFYCHFPDKLLTQRTSLLKRIYRLPMDLLEEVTTKMADVIVVNSEFTKTVFQSSFSWITTTPRVLYPGIRLEAYESKSDYEMKLPKKQYILSINRFERKKNLALAIQAFDILKSRNDFGNFMLVMAENVEHLKELDRLAHDLGLVTFTWKPNVAVPHDTNVLFLPSFSEEQRTFLLCNSVCLLYTPSEEHFGIVPLEAMYSELPVIAVNSGGPKETILHGTTGYLCDPNPIAFADHILTLINHKEFHLFRKRGRDHVRSKFSLSIFIDQLEEIVLYTRDQVNLDAAITYYTVLLLFACFPLLVLHFII